MASSRHNRGVTLVQVLVGGVILAIGIAGTLKVTSVLQRQVASDARLAPFAVEKAITGSLAQKIDNLAKSTCGGGAVSNPANTISAVSTIAIPGLGTLDATSAISYPLGIDSYADQAIARCTSPTSPQTQTAQGGYYFCLQINRGAGLLLSRSDLFSADQAFIEVRANLVDLGAFTSGDRGPFPSCAAYRANPLAGIVLYYRVYWNRRSVDALANFTFNGKSVFPKP